MEIVSLILLIGLVAGYLVLAGCDIGLGMLMPYVARTGAERRRAVSAMAPYFLGSEVWLLGAIGVTIGLFPAVKTAVIAGMWPVFVALLAAWLFRDAGLWMRPRTGGRASRAVCDAWIVAGSWGLALSWGFVIGGLLGGGRLLSPFTIACTLASATLFALRGAAFGAERLVPAGPGGDAAATDGARDTVRAVGAEDRAGSERAAAAQASGHGELTARSAQPGGMVPQPSAQPLTGGSGAAGGETGAAGSAGGRADHGGGRAPAAGREAYAAADSAEGADAAACATRPLARAALAAAVLAAGASLLPGGAAPDRPLAAAAAAFVLLGALAATSGLSGPRLSRHTSALAMALVPLLIAASINLPVAPVPDGAALLFWSAMLPVVPFIVVGQYWLYRMLRRPAPTSGFFA